MIVSKSSVSEVPFYLTLVTHLKLRSMIQYMSLCSPDITSSQSKNDFHNQLFFGIWYVILLNSLFFSTLILCSSLYSCYQTCMGSITGIRLRLNSMGIAIPVCFSFYSQCGSKCEASQCTECLTLFLTWMTNAFGGTKAPSLLVLVSENTKCSQ